MLSSYHGDAKQEQMTSLLNKTRGIEDMLARDHMKVAFFGRTSNGKSTVVNALLRDKVLPTGIGHTTSCFCSVTGIDEPSGFITIPGSSDRKEIKSLQLLAHSLHKERLSTDSLVNVYWPKNKCPILQEDVEFVDSPGIDMNPDVDKWINDHCLNADVFVLVSNAESTLMNAEKNFFYRVSERLSRPNLFILNNRWDASAQEEPSLMEEVKQQHMENDVSFLSQVTDPSAAKERVYFISAKEVLTLRTREETEEKDKGKGLADGYKARLMEFERFEDKFKECLSSSAIRTKFEQHHSRGMEIVSELAQLLENEEKEAVERNAAVNAKLQSTCSRLQELNEKGHLTYNLAREKAIEMASEVEQRVQSSMKDLMQHITS
jgi:mitofusin